MVDCNAFGKALHSWRVQMIIKHMQRIRANQTTPGTPEHTLKVYQASARIMKRKRGTIALDKLEEMDPLDIRLKRHCVEHATADVDSQDLDMSDFDSSQQSDTPPATTDSDHDHDSDASDFE